MKNFFLIIIMLTVITSCGTTNNRSDAYWDSLLLHTGYLTDLNDVTPYQKEFLGKIKSNYENLEKKSLTYSKKVFDEWYQSECSISELEILGLALPDENSEIWELYIESHEQDKYLIVVVIFDGFDIKNHTVID